MVAAEELLHEVRMPPPNHPLLRSKCWLVSELRPVLHERMEDILDRPTEPAALPWLQDHHGYSWVCCPVQPSRGIEGWD